jgi:hypothetical protein
LESILAATRRLRPDLLVATWKGDPRQGRAERLKAVAQGAPCPVLILREPEPSARQRQPGARVAPARRPADP